MLNSTTGKIGAVVGMIVGAIMYKKGFGYSDPEFWLVFIPSLIFGVWLDKKVYG